MLRKAPKDVVQTKNWYKDRYQYVLVQRKILAAITFVSLVCTLASVVLIARLVPLKTVEPFVIQVDQKSGIVQTVDPLTVTELTGSTAVTNANIVQYIRARESYNIADLGRNYEIVRVMSEDKRVYQEFRAQVNPNNASSNAARLGTTGIRTVKFRAFSYLNPSTVQARVTMEEKNDRGILLINKIITLSFEYVKISLNMEERYMNPLGFRVTSYSISEETLSE